jgi:cyclic pyranopterin phosphate synthase
LSVTDACNFRCVYCLPNGYQKAACGSKNDGFLTVAEIARLGRAFAGLGVWKVRLTGGEPTVRRDILEIARRLSTTAGIRRVALSTNGYCLRHQARQFYDSGISALNISVDSLSRERFQRISGQDRLDDVLGGVEEALTLGFSCIKINTVLLKGENDVEFDDFIEHVRTRPVSVRFIELMPTGLNREFFERHHVKSTTIRERLLERGWCVRGRAEAEGPAVEFTHPGYLGRIGIIAPYSRDFCSDCTRLRVSSRGGLSLCLFGEGTFSLRNYLQDDSQIEQLQEEVCSLLLKKAESHYLYEGKHGGMQTLSAIGG